MTAKTQFCIHLVCWLMLLGIGGVNLWLLATGSWVGRIFAIVGLVLSTYYAAVAMYQCRYWLAVVRRGK